MELQTLSKTPVLAKVFSTAVPRVVKANSRQTQPNLAKSETRRISKRLTKQSTASFNNLKSAEPPLKFSNKTRLLVSNSNKLGKSPKMRAATIPKDKAQQVAHLEALFSQVDSRLEVKRVVIPSLSPISDLE